MILNGWKTYLKFNGDFINEYDEDSDIGYFLEVDVDYPKKLFNLHKDLTFLPERKKVEKVKKLICSKEDKEKYVIHIRALKQALNHGLKLKQVHRVIQFKQEEWLKPYIDTNTELRTETKNKFEIDLFKLINNSVFEKHQKIREIIKILNQFQNLIIIRIKNFLNI